MSSFEHPKHLFKLMDNINIYIFCLSETMRGYIQLNSKVAFLEEYRRRDGRNFSFTEPYLPYLTKSI